MKFLVPNYSCLQNPWLRGCSPQIPVISVLCPQMNLLNPPLKKIPGYATGPYWQTRLYNCSIRLTCCVQHVYQYSKTLLFFLRILHLQNFVHFLDRPDQMPLRKVFPGFYAIFRLSQQGHKIGVLLYIPVAVVMELVCFGICCLQFWPYCTQFSQFTENILPQSIMIICSPTFTQQVSVPCK